MGGDKRNFRLSKDVLPSRYELRFELEFDAWSSTGWERIGLRSSRASREITLHAIELDIVAATIDAKNKLERAELDPESETATLRFASEIPAGEHVLEISWKGGIRDSLRGLYRSLRGEERYAATQFEAADARRAFPCFDEPEFKARFSLELIHPAGNAAIGNMPITSQEAVDERRTRTRFRETPKISSYLVAFTVGPYEFTPSATTPSGIPVRVCLPPGLAEQGIYARDAHVRSVEWLQDYTAIPYPYIKVDAIGIPDFEAGAMENPGAITYRTRLLAADDRNASIQTLKGIFSTAAHELTHMWWGDLVTMRWWTDLWLNESFASFVGEKATAALNPEWRYWRDFVADNTSAFNLDALASTHPISVEAKSAEEASQRFDAISYTKGAAVLRMIEGYLGDETFREGVRIYLKRHAEANASADDFWRALDGASGQDVTAIANAWIKEPGHPLVHISAKQTAGALELELRQERYFSDSSAKPTGQVWPVPMVVKYGTAEGIREQRFVLRRDRETVRLEGAKWFFPNAGGRGFYRFAFASAVEGDLLDQGVAQLSAEERLALLDDLWALVRHGKATLATFLHRVETLRGEQDRAVLASIADALTWLANYAVRDATERPFARLVEDLFRPILDATGWRPADGEDSDVREKRTRAIGMLGLYARSDDVRAEAQRLVRAHLDNGERLHPDVAGTVVAVAATIGDARLWDRYVARMQQAQAADAQEEARFRQGLVFFEDSALARRTAEAVFSPLIRVQDRGIMLIPMLQFRRTRPIAWEVVKGHWDADVANADVAPLLKQSMVNAVSQLAQRGLADEAAAFLEQKRTPDVAETVAQALERLRVNTAAAERLADELETELRVPTTS
ncbi:MAG TPA: M1 family metallopeptidase [Candidatus Limnocylindria bacterium]